MQVKFFDLKKQNDVVKNEIFAQIQEVIDSNMFILGDKVKKLEEEIAAYSGAKHAVALSSGTDALIIALMALGINLGDEVITTPFTFFATVGSIVRTGGAPVFADIDPVTFNIDPDDIRKKITESTKCIIPVHLYGQSADMDAINEIAREYGLRVIEDAAQAIGARVGDKGVGGMSDIGCFSFFPTKNLGAFGDAGLVTCNDDEIYRKLVMLRNHGSEKRYYHEFIGGNFRMDAIQAAALLVKFKKLDEYIEKRRENAAKYDELLNGIDGITLPKEASGYFHTYNQYVITTSRRDELKEHLAKNGIGTEIYYPLSLHQQECFEYLGYSMGDLPVAEKTSQTCLALPIYPELTDGEIEYVAENIRSFK